MSDVLGEITYSSPTSANWEIRRADLLYYRTRYPTVNSPDFSLGNTTCHFRLVDKPNTNGGYSQIVKFLGMRPPYSRFQFKTEDRIEELTFINEEPRMECPALLSRTEVFSIYIDIEPPNEVSIGDQGVRGTANTKRSLNQSSVAKTKKQRYEEETPRSKSGAKLISDFKEILLNEKGSDVVLKVQGRDFKAHSLILGSRSPVFAAMFGHEMKEKNSGVAVIEDCDQETFPDILHYIYTGTVENLSLENAQQLYMAADKYQLAELKEECLEYLKNHISVENFFDVMTFSFRREERELTEAATDFFMVNAAEIITTVKWMTFLSQNVTAANELIVKLIAPTKTR